MQINFLKKVVENTAGIEAVRIVDLLYGKKDVNEFLIAKKLALTINQTRNLLYRLSHLGIITSIRKKDKRKGWYIYFWTFNVMKSLEVLEQTLSNEINALKIKLEAKKTERFYKCKICGREANEETALLTNFVCSECGEVYGLADNAPIIEEISKKIEKLQKELNSILNEIRDEQETLDKSLANLIKREDKKKKELRKKNMKKMKMARNKLKGKVKLNTKSKKSKSKVKTKKKKK